MVTVTGYFGVWGAMKQKTGVDSPVRSFEKPQPLAARASVRSDLTIKHLRGYAQFLAELGHLRLGFAHGRLSQLTFAGVILYETPPFRPRARAEASPAFVLSDVSSLSNSAKAAKMLKMSFPDGAAASMEVPCPVRTLRPFSFDVRSWFAGSC